jgi:hypothetical protein
LNRSCPAVRVLELKLGDGRWEEEEVEALRGWKKLKS